MMDCNLDSLIHLLNPPLFHDVFQIRCGASPDKNLAVLRNQVRILLLPVPVFSVLSIFFSITAIIPNHILRLLLCTALQHLFSPRQILFLAFTTKTSIGGDERAVAIPKEILSRLSFGEARELLVYLVLAIACAVVGWVYVRTFDAVHGAFSRLRRVPRWLRPALGGLLLGLLALAIAPIAGEHGVLFGGYRLMLGSIETSVTIGALLLLIPAKILATSLSIGSFAATWVRSTTAASPTRRSRAIADVVAPPGTM